LTKTVIFTHQLLIYRGMKISTNIQYPTPLICFCLFQSDEVCHFVLIAGQPINEPVVQHGKDLCVVLNFSLLLKQFFNFS